MVSVFIVGSEGTTGLRLKERIAMRGDIRLIEISESRRKDTEEITRLMGQADFTFLCLPDTAARELAALSEGTGTRIIDTSTAHRTANGWTYGFPEISPQQRGKIAGAARVSSPGCHSSGFIALITPLVATGLLSPDTALSCTSLTGYSGGGKKMIARYEDTNRPAELSGAFLYSMSQSHKHLPEMTRYCNLTNSPVFMPVVCDFYSGMLVTVPLCASMLPAGTDCGVLRKALSEHYAGSRIIRVTDDAPDGLYANAMSGIDSMEIFVSGCGGRFLLTALFDNLGKGASGAAIQCLNIMCGLPEDTGLKTS